MIADDDLEHVLSRRIVGYHETITARLAAKHERTTLDVDRGTPVLAITRTARTTTNPLSQLELVARADRFEVDYITDA